MVPGNVIFCDLIDRYQTARRHMQHNHISDTRFYESIYLSLPVMKIMRCVTFVLFGYTQNPKT